jgi:hypothetical protein
MNAEKYTRDGQMHARHIVCPSRETAYTLYSQLRNSEDEKDWLMAVARYSSNEESSKQGGDLGWFDRLGLIPALPYGREFAELIWEWELGLHEPVMISGEWHLIDIMAKEQDRPLTLEEARDRVVEDLKPVLEEEQVDNFIRELRGQTQIEYLGAYALGKGKSAKELFERAWYTSSPDQKIDIYNLILDDYPDSELIDETLFLLASVYYDTWGDIPAASRYLDQLCREHPGSDFYDDAEYMLENMGRADFRKPLDIEDLHPAQQQD